MRLLKLRRAASPRRPSRNASARRRALVSMAAASDAATAASVVRWATSWSCTSSCSSRWPAGHSVARGSLVAAARGRTKPRITSQGLGRVARKLSARLRRTALRVGSIPEGCLSTLVEAAWEATPARAVVHLGALGARELRRKRRRLLAPVALGGHLALQLEAQRGHLLAHDLLHLLPPQLRPLELRLQARDLYKT